MHTPICDMLGIEYPVFAFNHCPDVIAAVCNAGGLGVLGVSSVKPEEIRVETEWLRKHTDKPFGLDLLLPQGNPETATREELLSRVPKENVDFMNKLRRELGLPEGYIQKSRYTQKSGDSELGIGIGGTRASQMDQVEMICELKPALFAGGLGMNTGVVEKCHRSGIKVASLIGNVRQARRAASRGVDIIVAQGTEAGGHTGNIGTMSLVPLVVDAVKPVPVLAAGGIADGRGLVAGLALGAAGVWTGTVWLTAHEDPLEGFIKDRIIAATEEDAVLTKVYSGKQRRVLRNKFVEYWSQPGAPKPLPAPYQMLYLPLRNFASTEDTDRTWEKLGLQDWISAPAGQAIGLLKQRKPAKQILYEMVAEAVEILGDD